MTLQNLIEIAARIIPEVNLTNFKISDRWITRFKQHNDIVSRKIKEWVPPTYNEDQADLQAIAENFVQSIRPRIDVFGLTNCFNADQTGLQFEMHTGRTLRTRGEFLLSFD